MLPSLTANSTIAERPLTILQGTSSPANPGQAPDLLALAALGWILEDGDRAARFLSLTGLDPDSLRNALEEPSTLAAVLEFLANHEADLIRASEALAVTPEELVAAMKELRE